MYLIIVFILLVLFLLGYFFLYKKKLPLKKIIDANEQSFKPFKFYPSNKPMLWSACKSGKHEIWILGTVHFGEFHTGSPAEKILQIMGKCDGLIVETQMMGIAAIEAGQINQKIISNNDLTKMISQDNINKMIETLKVPLDSLNKMTPFQIFHMLFPTKGAINNQNISDEQLIISARSLEKKIYCLETMEFQLSLLNNIYNFEKIERKMNENYQRSLLSGRFADLFFKGEIETLYSEVLNIFRLDGLSEDELGQLLDQRNQDWAQKLNKLSDYGSFLVAVGAAHLLGENGLIECLKKDGYKLNKYF